MYIIPQNENMQEQNIVFDQLLRYPLKNKYITPSDTFSWQVTTFKVLIF